MLQCTYRHKDNCGTDNSNYSSIEITNMDIDTLEPDSKLIVKVSSKDTLREYARIALDSKMYVDDGKHLLEHEYRRIITGRGYRPYSWVKDGKTRMRPEWIVGLGYVGDRVVGCVVIHKFVMQIYVDPGWRRRGVATRIVYGISMVYGLDHKVGMHVTYEASRGIAEHLGVVDMRKRSIVSDKGNYIPGIEDTVSKT